jgi:putative transposase
MKYNPNIHHRRSIRLKNYDYSQKGFYFVTICIQNREHLLGEIRNQEMMLNDAGRMIHKWYNELENKFTDIKCHEMITMPNHFHCIIENAIVGVGADLRVCPNNTGEHIEGEHIGSPLHRVVQWFKTMTTNEYIRGVKQNGWQRFNKKLWQRNYWEYIVRNNNEFNRISQYIINNPKKWEIDKFK